MIMALKDLTLKEDYRSDESDIITDFYIPCLKNSIKYDRAVGYFTSNALALAAKGVAELLRNNGTMRLIASPNLQNEDIEAIRRGMSRDQIIEDALFRELDNIEDIIIKKRLDFLAWMIAQGLLEIKIASPKDELGGLFHEKVGFFHDDFGDVVSFSGSANETSGGLYSNFENIDVFCSWVPGDQGRVRRKLENFKRLWENKTRFLDVTDIPTAIKNKLLSYKGDDLKYSDPEGVIDPSSDYKIGPSIPTNIELRPYQKEALSTWVGKKCRGILEMATGTGKTITALAAAVRLHDHCKKLAVIIVCPYLHLVDQWYEEVMKFGFTPLKCCESTKRWEMELGDAITNFNLNLSDNFSIITTNRTLSTSKMQQFISRVRSKFTLFIADEAHHLGANYLSTKLPPNMSFRLGLSATP